MNFRFQSPKYTLKLSSTAVLILQKAGQKIVLNIRKDVFIKIENMAISQINATPVGMYPENYESNINLDKFIIPSF